MTLAQSKGHNALVTGATGYIGSNLVKRLIADGWNVHIITRPCSSLNCLAKLSDKLTLHEHDGTTSEMVEIMAKAAPDTVFHLASFFLSEHSPQDVENLITDNILFSTQLIQAMVENGISRLVNTGTSWQYYNGNTYNPVNLYAATKQAFENLLEFYLTTSNLKAITLALFDTYGPNDKRKKLIPFLINSLTTNEELGMSPGQQLVDFVYIDDVINAFLIAEKQLSIQSAKHQVYGVSSKHPLTLIDLVQIFENVMGMKLPISWGTRAYRTREVMIPWKGFKCLPNWEPEVSLSDGLLKIKKHLAFTTT